MILAGHGANGGHHSHPGDSDPAPVGDSQGLWPWGGHYHAVHAGGGFTGKDCQVLIL